MGEVVVWLVICVATLGASPDNLLAAGLKEQTSWFEVQIQDLSHPHPMLANGTCCQGWYTHEATSRQKIIHI